MIIEKQVPQNITAEEAVLGSILIDELSIHRVAPFLRAEHFYVEKNGWIFQTALDLIDQHTAIDMLTVADKLERDQRLEEVGGFAYIASLMNAVPTAIHIEHYAKIIETAWIGRRLISVAGDIAKTGYEIKDSEEALGASESLIFGISARRTGGGITHIREGVDAYYERLDRIANTTGPLGLGSGYYDIDFMLDGLQDGDLILVAARPQVGKTSLLVSMANNIALRNEVRKPVLMFSLEMSTTQLTNRLLSMNSRVDGIKVRNGKMDDDELARVSRASGELASSMIHIDDTSGLDISIMRSRARRAKMELDISAIFVDYLQLITSHIRENRVQEVSYISRQLKDMARELNIPVVAACQLNRAVEQRPDHRPVISDLRESGGLEQDSDVVMLLYRDELYDANTLSQHIAEVNIAKQRNGPTGLVKLYYFKELTLFANLVRRDATN